MTEYTRFLKEERKDTMARLRPNNHKISQKSVEELERSLYDKKRFFRDKWLRFGADATTPVQREICVMMITYIDNIVWCKGGVRVV